MEQNLLDQGQNAPSLSAESIVETVDDGSSLCKACKDLFAGNSEDLGDGSYVHHNDIFALEDSASNGCSFCNFILGILTAEDAAKVDVLKIRIAQAKSQLKLGVNPPWLKGSSFASWRTMYQLRNPEIRLLAPLAYFFEPYEFGKRICYSEKGQ